jgi:hypothetical protein
VREAVVEGGRREGVRREAVGRRRTRRWRARVRGRRGRRWSGEMCIFAGGGGCGGEWCEVSGEVVMGCADWEFEVVRLMWLELVVSVWLVDLMGC